MRHLWSDVFHVSCAKEPGNQDSRMSEMCKTRQGMIEKTIAYSRRGITGFYHDEILLELRATT